MGALNRALATIKAYLGRLTVSQKLLMGSLAVIMVMTLWLVRQYAGVPENVALLEPNASADRQSRALQFVQANFIPHTVDSTGIVRVPPGRQYAVLAQMSQQGKLPDDNHLLFDSLIGRQSWTQTYQQNAMMETVAVQNELGRIISQFDGIESANVIMDVPKNRGLGQPRTAPTAAVTVFASKGLDQNAVDAIAHLVASSRSGLSTDNVRVVDGKSKRQYRARDDRSAASASYQEFQNAVEDRKQRQVYDMLSAYIRGVVVTVHAQVDVTHKTSTTRSVLPSGKGSETLVKSETSNEKKSAQGGSGGGAPGSQAGGEAGARSNVGADIAGTGGTPGNSMNDTESKTDYEAKFGEKTEMVDDPRGFATKINAVVNIPRSYFAEIYKSQQAGAAPAGGAGGAGGTGGTGAAGEPKDTDLKPIVDAETARIKREVALQIDTSAADKTVPGEVEVSMIPSVISAEGPTVEKAGFFSFGSGGGSLAVGDLVKTVGLGAMAVAALGLVVMTAFRASKQQQLPSAQELVGVPPTLPGDSDIVGEAGEADSVLAGLELTDDDMKERKILEQVEAVAKDRPKDAASIIGRWMSDT